MTYRIAYIGEPLAEISTANSGFKVAYGGDTLNTAIYCRRAVGSDAEVAYVTALGHDPLSAGALTLMNAEAISTNHVTLNPDHQIGIYAIHNDADGERSFFYWRETSAARQMFIDPMIRS